ncbi:MAG: MBL fold metallo-hydrolase, partial [Clostridiales bacterium]|nr:MBL fold metallo-hydrolase [Clostridiales bacterium]
MYELIHAAGSSYYIQSPAKIGLVKLSDDEVCLIDSGNDKNAGRKVRQILDANGWKLKAIYNTHSHADHIGGNQYLQKQTGCRIYAPGMECSFTRHPVLESVCLYGGCAPADLRHKFLMAQESNAEYLTDDCLPEGMEQISLPGHSFDMLGFRTADDVLYLADCLSAEETLEKYQISYLYDV